MLYIPVIAAIENKLKEHSHLKNLRFYRFSIPSSSVRSPFVCIPFTRVDTYTTHSSPCIKDVVTHSCVGNYWDQHRLKLPILIGAARHNALDADEVLDILQNAVLTQILSDRSMDGSVRLCEPSEIMVDSFFEISDQFKGAVLTLDIKFIDEPVIPYDGEIKYLLDPEVFVEETG